MMQKSDIKSASKSLSTRGVGRPKSGYLQGDELKEHVISAASLIYSESGYRDTSVAKIIKAAGISRPLFYRLFKSTHEVIDIIVKRANEALFEMLSTAMDEQDDIIGMMKANIDTYFEWCRNYGPVVGPIYREISDPESPAFHHRQWIVERSIKQFNYLVTKQGHQALPEVFIEGLVHVMEHIGSTTFWPKAQAESVVMQNKKIVQRILLAALAHEGLEEHIPPLSSL